ncbi:heme o synthase [Ornithinibacillus xuwenensis]|uniref:Protoheme IX farnesyltransferase n=1 Tax=Ornithinibacillus xuwenensis TaxID=3144668 RepID=A0ABU9XE85_9BACI
MDNAETTSSQIMGDANVSTGLKSETTIISDVKALIKVGIVNSNLITAFTGFLLALHFTDAAFRENWQILLLTLSGTAFVIAGGCILNNWYDADIDPLMTRTKTRPTVTGTLSMQTILVLGLSSTAIGFLLLVFTTIEAALIAMFGWFVYVILYTMWTKRRYTLNTIVGSFSGAVPPLIGWAAIEPSIHIVPVALFLLMFVWQTPHFLALAMKKTEEYRYAGVPMLPVVYGFEFTKRQIVIYIACLLPLPFLLFSLGPIFLCVASLLNIGWLVIGLRGFLTKDDMGWANKIFVYSLNYLVIMFLTMAIVTIELPF